MPRKKSKYYRLPDDADKPRTMVPRPRTVAYVMVKIDGKLRLAGRVYIKNGRYVAEEIKES